MRVWRRCGLTVPRSSWGKCGACGEEALTKVGSVYDGKTGLTSDYKVMCGRVAYVLLHETGVEAFDQFVGNEGVKTLEAIIYIGKHKKLPPSMVRIIGQKKGE